MGNGKKDTIDIPQYLIKNVTDLWNRSVPVGPRKFIPEYKIEIIFNDNSIRSFRINGNIIKEDNDYCFMLLCSENYFDNLVQTQ